ncbi:MAG: helix-turn-helix domain-containing protein [Aminipila sp.]
MENIEEFVEMLPKIVANRMAERRVQDLDLTFDQLEAISGISGSTLHRIEHKAVKSLSLESVYRISIALDCNFLWLIGLSDDKYDKGSNSLQSLPVIPKTIETYLSLPVEKRKAVDDLIMALSKL